MSNFKSIGSCYEQIWSDKEKQAKGAAQATAALHGADEGSWRFEGI